jgi:preprotein translocase subunit SecF
VINKDYLNSILEYRDGDLYWKEPKRGRRLNRKIGVFTKQKYLKITINDKTYLLHRIIYIMFHGNLNEQIDHIDGNSNNNRIENLRKATNSQNNQNKPISKANKSGFKNVSWSKQKKSWKVQIDISNVKTFFGYYKDLELADLVAQEARNKYHKEFARHF